jgi:hypothetical protein
MASMTSTRAHATQHADDAVHWRRYAGTTVIERCSIFCFCAGCAGGYTSATRCLHGNNTFVVKRWNCDALL